MSPGGPWLKVVQCWASLRSWPAHSLWLAFELLHHEQSCWLGQGTQLRTTALCPPNEALRFLPGGRAFQRRTHLVARLALALSQPNLRGCGVPEQEVWDLIQLELGARQPQPPSGGDLRFARC